MFRKILFIVGLLCSLPILSVHVAAHGSDGHSSYISTEDIVNVATKYVVRLVEKKSLIEGKALDASWLKIPKSDKKLTRESSWYYVVQLHHASKHKTLYLLIAKTGKLYRADYKGIFNDIK